MKLYAKVGESRQFLTMFVIPINCIEMLYYRPTGNYVAQEDGTWKEIEYVEEI
jgi:hypothetical protein